MKKALFVGGGGGGGGYFGHSIRKWNSSSVVLIEQHAHSLPVRWNISIVMTDMLAVCISSKLSNDYPLVKIGYFEIGFEC